jgi:small subunit ribosomal protein S6
MKTYEGMFLVDASASEFETAAEPVRQALGRISAETLVLKPWDERRLAYPIAGRRRGLYIISYFKADPAEIANLKHEVAINEDILRLMVLSADHVSEETMNAETPATSPSQKRDSRDGDRRDSRSRDRRGSSDRSEQGQRPAAAAKPAAEEARPAAPDKAEPAAAESPAAESPAAEQAAEAKPAEPESPAEGETAKSEPAGGEAAGEPAQPPEKS